LIVGIGAVLFLMVRKDGGCCGGGHDDNHEPQKKELSGHSQQDAEKKPRGVAAVNRINSIK
jgi:hypothetical protein